MPATDRELIKEMSRLLLQGARMLDEACPKCGTPLFLMKDVGLRYCPKCKVYYATPEDLKSGKIDASKFQIYDFDEYWKKKEAKAEKKEEAKRTEEVSKPTTTDSLTASLIELSNAVIDKLIEKIEREDLSVDELLNVLERVFRLLKS